MVRQRTASAPSSAACWKAAWNAPGEGAAVCGQVALAAAALPELGRGELAPVLELLVAEADGQRHHDDVVLLDELVGQVAGTVGDDVDAGHARVCHGGGGAAAGGAGAQRRGAGRSVSEEAPGAGGSSPACRDDATRRVAPGGPVGADGAAGDRRVRDPSGPRPGPDGTRRAERRCVSCAPAQPDHDGAEGEAAGDHGADDPGQQAGDAGRRRRGWTPRAPRRPWGRRR